MYKIYALDPHTSVNYLNDKFKMDPINGNLGMNDANRAYRNRLYKTHINLNKPFKSIEIKN